MAQSQAGRFTTGSTMRHVAVMTFTGMAGLSFMFLVDFATLFYVSLLGDETLTAGVGFAWAVQFFTISIGIGLAIGATALVSRSIGARDRDRARRHATSAVMTTVLALAIMACTVLIFRRDILGMIGAEGEAADVAARFLLISVPSLSFVGLAMVTSSVLRAEGDAKRSMYVTMAGGFAAMGLDPLFIFTFGLGVDGAAYAMVISRMISGSIGVYFCIKAHDLLAKPSLTDVRVFVRPFAAIALPAMMTQLSTPLGNIILTKWIAEFGDSAVAGWAVASRLTVLAFGGIFALSGAIGGIIGQNYGAGLADRVGMAYRDSLIFAAGYVVAAWALLAIFAPYIVAGFGVSDTGASVVYAFCYIGAGGFMFNGALFVANAAFNNLGKPYWSTGFNWSRDGILIPLMLVLIPTSFGAPGVVYAQALAGVIVGAMAVWAGWRLSHGLDLSHMGEKAEWSSVANPASSGRGAAAMMVATKDPAE